MSKLKTTQIAAIVVVAIIIVAAVGVLALGNGKESTKIESVLPVYGNANNDYVIDNDDIQIIKDIISGNKSKEDYPLADAYKDGVIDQKDIDQTQAIIDGKATKVWHVNQIGDEQTTVETKWPIKAAMATATPNVAVYFAMLGIADKIKAISYSSVSKPDTLLIPEFDGMESIGSSTKIEYDNASKYVTDYGCTAIVTSTNASYMSNYADIEAHGIDVVRIDATGTSIDDFLGGILLLAFLFDSNDKVEKICTFCESLVSDINKKLEGVTDRPVAVASNTTGSIAAKTSDYTELLTVAGATLPTDSRYSSSIKIASSDWIYEIQIDKVVNMRTGGGVGGNWYAGTLSDTAIKAVFDPFSKMKAYENNEIYIIDGELPIPIRLAYTAEVLFPEIFESGYADKAHQDFCDEIYGEGKFDISALKFIYNVADYK